MTFHLNSHTTTDVKPNILSDVKKGNGIPHDTYNVRGIAYPRKNRKEDIFMHQKKFHFLIYQNLIL